VKINLKVNKDGYPILPSHEEINSLGLMYAKQLIGKFIADVYSLWAADRC
jgi:hypothetical protein